MKAVDANVLIYAVNSDAAHHTDSLAWLEGSLNGGDTVGFVWNAILAFCRITTHPSLMPSPLAADEAIDQVDAWLSSPHARILHPGTRHLGLLRELLAATGGAGNLVNDAHIAATALEHGASLVSFDSDFSRFPNLTWATPTALLRV